MDTSATATFNLLDQHLYSLGNLATQIQNFLIENPSTSLPQGLYEQLSRLADSLGQDRKQAHSLEEERRSLRALASMGQVVNSSIELDEVLQIVMDTIIRLTGAERGFLMLRNEQGDLGIRIARNWDQETLNASEFAISHTIIERVANEGQPVLTTNAQEDPRFGGQQSVIAYNLRSILCVPLRVKSVITGVIYADNRIRSGLFTQSDLDLLAGFANQAAVAIENARLFASVRKTLTEVTQLKNLMDNVFASIASGVLTADTEERVVLCNRAAEQILGRAAIDMVGFSLLQSLEPMAPTLLPHIQKVLQKDSPVIGMEISQDLPLRGHVDLRLSLTPLKDVEQHTQGVAIVVDDLTEKKRLEAQRRLFERMVSPAVIEQLNPNSLQLGGRRTEISALFADVRGFTSFSETVSPEELVSILNRHLGAAAEAILAENGTIDKFLGDAVMAWFNAPIPQADHALRAVRAAIGIRNAIHNLHNTLPHAACLSFGVGIHIGDAILGLVGSERRLEYTAIGDSVNTAKRIQENAAAGQILITSIVQQQIEPWVITKPVGEIQAKGKREPIPVYEVIELREN